MKNANMPTELHELPELLAPSGAEDSLYAALAAGADAVYFGGRSFSNRMRAKNFTDDSLRHAISLTHDCGAKAYVTLNTRIREREMSDVLSLCEVILGGKDPCDAVICADLGLAKEIRARYPHAVLHASTQTSCSSPADCEQLAKLGFSRLVIPRELSHDEIKTLCQTTPMEIEMFLHGAHCVSLSGQCLMSYFVGGRSGNRGECAQPCRLPWTCSDKNGAASNPSGGYPLSLADMCLAGRMTDVISSGVCSLKIEGRLKTPSYVYGVTKIYRTLLDERRNATPAEVKALSDLFTRGFTDGYFTKKYYTMSGAKASEKNTLIPTEKIRSEFDARVKAEKERRKASDEQSKLPLCGEFTMKSGENVRLTLTLANDSSVSAGAAGDIPSPSSGRPVDEGAAVKNLTKFGGTRFVMSAGSLKCTIDENLWLPVSALNDLRRRALAELEAKISAAEALSAEKMPENAAEAAESAAETAESAAESAENTAPTPRKSHIQEKTAEFLDVTPLLEARPAEIAAIFSKFDRVFVPFSDVREVIGIENAEREKVCAVLPALEPSSEKIDEILGDLAKLGVKRVMAHTVGQASQSISRGFAADISFRGNITNTAAMSVYENVGCAAVYLSPELPAAAVSAMRGAAAVYGKLPAMTLSRCVICQAAGKKCTKGNIGGRSGTAKPHRCRAWLTDRVGAEFPVFSGPSCENVICNSQTVWMGDKTDTLRGASILHWFFTDEKASEVLEVMRKYERGETSSGRRLG